MVFVRMGGNVCPCLTGDSLKFVLMNPGESVAPKTQFCPPKVVLRIGPCGVAISLMLKSHEILQILVSGILFRMVASARDTQNLPASFSVVQEHYNPFP